MQDLPPTYYRYERREMLQFVPRSASSVLEVGCGAGAFLRILAAGRPDLRVKGIEPNPEASEAGRRDGLDIVTGMFPAVLDDDNLFDCIVFNDVLEHMVDPWAALEAARRLLSENGVLVASLPNIRHFDVLREIIVDGDFRYREEGVLDATHLRFFTMTSARRMFEQMAYEVESVTGINSRPPARRKRPLLWALGLRSRSFRHEATFRQFALVARPSPAR